MTKQEFDILILMTEADQPMTQREIAEKLGISRSYVSRIEKSALEKLKSALGG